MKARHTFVQMLKTKDQGKILELLEEKAIAYRGTKAADLSIEVLCIRRPRSDIIKKKKHKESNQVKSLFNKTTFKQWKQNKDPPPTHTQMNKWKNTRAAVWHCRSERRLWGGVSIFQPRNFHMRTQKRENTDVGQTANTFSLHFSNTKCLFVL